MNLHIIVDNTYSNSLLTDIRMNFNDKSNDFLLIVNREPKYIEQVNLNICTVYNYKDISNQLKKLLKVRKLFEKSNKVFFHMLTPPSVSLANLNDLKGKEIYWFLWGADLYKFASMELFSKETKKFIFKNQKNDTKKIKIKKILIGYLNNKMINFMKNIDYVVTWNKGDYDIAVKTFNLNAKLLDYHYPLRLKKELSIEKSSEMVPKILVGNSSDPSNNHVEIFEILSKIEGEFIVLSFLTYGLPEYKEWVIKKGFELLGEKFQPITEHMKLDEYMEYIEEIDIVIMNHFRQQGLGNMVSLLNKGKKLYMNDFVTTYEYLNNNGVNVYSNKELSRVNHIEDLVFYDENSKKQNTEKVFELFSDESSLNKMKNILK